MIVIKDHKDLKRTERYGCCLSCGTKKNLYQLEITHEGITHNFRLCKKCVSELKQKLGEIECLQ